MWYKNDDGDWGDEYDDFMWGIERKYTVLGGVIITVVLVVISLVKGSEWQKTVAIAISGIVITVFLWFVYSLPFIVGWLAAKLARLVKRIFGIKDSDE